MKLIWHYNAYGTPSRLAVRKNIRRAFRKVCNFVGKALDTLKTDDADEYGI